MAKVTKQINANADQYAKIQYALERGQTKVTTSPLVIDTTGLKLEGEAQVWTSYSGAKVIHVMVLDRGDYRSVVQFDGVPTTDDYIDAFMAIFAAGD